MCQEGRDRHGRIVGTNWRWPSATASRAIPPWPRGGLLAVIIESLAVQDEWLINKKPGALSGNREAIDPTLNQVGQPGDPEDLRVVGAGEDDDAHSSGSRLASRYLHEPENTSTP